MFFDKYYDDTLFKLSMISNYVTVYDFKSFETFWKELDVSNKAISTHPKITHTTKMVQLFYLRVVMKEVLTNMN